MTIASALVVTKYKMAAEIANKVVRELASDCTPGSSVRDLCCLGDKKLVEETSKAYKKDKKMSKGGADLINCRTFVFIVCSV